MGQSALRKPNIAIGISNAMVNLVNPSEYDFGNCSLEAESSVSGFHSIHFIILYFSMPATDKGPAGQTSWSGQRRVLPQWEEYRPQCQSVWLE